jgi:hypothetical protein
MRSARTSLTLLKRDDRVGLFLWARSRFAIPPTLSRTFVGAQKLENIPLWIPSKEGMTEREVSGWWLAAPDATLVLSPLSLKELDRLPVSVGFWTLACKWVIEALSRQQVVPSLIDGEVEGAWLASWRVAPVRPEDRARLAGLAAAMPGVARSSSFDGDRVLTPPAALRVFMDAAADGLLRSSTAATAPQPGRGPAWVQRLGAALAGPDATFEVRGLTERHLPNGMQRWTRQVTSLGGEGRPMVGFRLEEPTGRKRSGSWRISFHLLDATAQARVAVGDLQSGDDSARDIAGRMTKPTETLLEALGRCTRMYEPIGRSLTDRLPAGVEVDATEAWTFLTSASMKLQRAGYWVNVPVALSKVGRRRVRARMRLGEEQSEAPPSGLLTGMVNYHWEACLGADTLTASEFRKLVKSKAPLVLHRGEWVAVDPSDVARLETLMARGGGGLDAAEALRLALAGEVSVPGSSEVVADVATQGEVQMALGRLQQSLDETAEIGEPPIGLFGTLRPYQLRGLTWLDSVTGIGFGACLADDMGLGKTIQVLAHMMLLAEREGGQRCLVVCPTSVIGNWRREILRFTPGLGVLLHHGAGRPRDSTEMVSSIETLDADDGVLVITSYALVRRDIELFSSMEWGAVILDEAQNIKNSESAQSQAVRRISARRRIAMTGTPVENRLMELWSIMDFLNPGLLGTRGAFKKMFAIPIERYGDEEAIERLRRVTAPFVLRRLKTDPVIAPDLPEKIEAVRYCPLTVEQAALYQSALDQGMQEITALGPGMERRGRVLALLTALKQICNHPAHYLRDGQIDPRRSGKLRRFMELFDESEESGGHPLVFTQYREMGEILRGVLERHIGVRVPFYHGGLPRYVRERLVQEFQDPDGPPVMIVSLKAGGTGLNLTRANHVFHYDRWWNPAVEDQATDRAFRIGQTRDVTVHRLVSQGTLEEQIHQLLESKRNLADRVVGAGETWLSDLDDSTLHELVSLGSDAVLEEEL